MITKPNGKTKAPFRKFRHELKYLINLNQVYTLENQLPDLLMRDAHVGDEGFYRIRSLYFDDYKNTSFYENDSGVDPREKFRIRIYNSSSNVIHLELKRKEQGMIQKLSCSIDKELVQTIIQGQSIPWSDHMDPLLKKFFILYETRLLRPKVIVEYDRVPFVYPDGNVRVTLDLNIRTSRCVDDFFEDNIEMRTIMPSGMHLLEVKYDQFLPDFIYRSIQNNKLQRVTFSKYYLCRKYGDLL